MPGTKLGLHHRFEPGADTTLPLLLRPEALTDAVPLRPMVPLTEAPRADRAGKPVLMLSGAMDPIVPAENAARLARRLAAAGAVVEHRVPQNGHGLTRADVSLARNRIGIRSAPGRV